jgi:shikimate dehydrogenase
VSQTIPEVNSARSRPLLHSSIIITGAAGGTDFPVTSVVLAARATYVAADVGAKLGGTAAPGAGDEMRSITDIGASTKLCALIGNPVGHSMSPAIHNRAFAELGLDYVYLAFRVEDVGAAAAGMRALENFRGMSVTIPHKVSILKHLDEVAEVDRGIGSINTVVNDGGRLKGFGSDGPGALRALADAGVRVAGKRVTILGSGGAARAIAFSLAARAKPAALFLLGVVEPELKALGRDLVRKAGSKATWALLEPRTLEQCLAESQVLIHCTPVGMHPDTKASVVPKSLLHRNLAVMDIVYNPLKTKLLADAEARGLKTISGVEMFVNQALIQFELWTGKKAPRKVMREVVLEHLDRRRRKR